MTTNFRARRLPLLDAKVGDSVKHEGAAVTITAIERSPDGHHWRVWLDGKLIIVPPGCVFTRPAPVVPRFSDPVEHDHDEALIDRFPRWA